MQFFLYYKRLLFSFLTIIAFFTTSISTHAEKVTLQLKEGNLIVEGELLSFDGKTYTIQSDQLGKATFEVKRFTCIDGNCPKVTVNPFEFHDSISDFTIKGSNTIGTRLMPWIIRAYAKSKGLYSRETESNNKREVRFSLTDAFNKTEININLYRYGSSTAFPALEKKNAVIGMSDRTINDQEVRALTKAGVKNVKDKHEHVIGIDGIVVIVSPKNRVSNLTMKQLAHIFSGKITNWAQVGGRPGNIKVYAPDNKSGTYSTFRSLVLKPAKQELVSSAKRIDDNETLSRSVAQDANAIGITSFAYIDNSKPLGFKSKCGLVTKASSFNVQTGEYPLSRRLYLYTATAIENRHAVGLLNFAKNSPDMSSVLNIAGFIGKRIESITFNQQKERIFASMTQSDENFDPSLMRRLLTELNSARRLSYTARFEANSSDLTFESKKDFIKLVKHLELEIQRKNYIVIAGFADTRGAFHRNALLSHKRAKILKDLIAQSLSNEKAQSKLIARGFGELLPAACNDTEEGRKANRRVEIWVVNEADGKKLAKNQTFKTLPPITPPVIIPESKPRNNEASVLKQPEKEASEKNSDDTESDETHVKKKTTNDRDWLREDGFNIQF